MSRYFDDDFLLFLGDIDLSAVHRRKQRIDFFLREYLIRHRPTAIERQIQ